MKTTRAAGGMSRCRDALWFVDAPGGKIEPDAKKLRTAACLNMKMEPRVTQNSRSRKIFAIFALRKAEADTGVDFEALRRRIPTMRAQRLQHA